MTQPLIQTYLFFNGNCEKALEFYKTTLGIEVTMLMRFKESPDPVPPGMVPPGWEDKIMHGEFRIGESTVMVSDGCQQSNGFEGFCLSISVKSEAEADRYFNALADGGKITMPIGKTFWSPRFGALEDRFGLGWMINTLPAE